MGAGLKLVFLWRPLGMELYLTHSGAILNESIFFMQEANLTNQNP